MLDRNPEQAGEVGGDPCNETFDLSEVQSEQSWCAHGSKADERQQLAHIQEVLASIFEYYACQGTVALKEPRLTNAKFQRMAMDAVLVDEQLTTAKVDVTFHRVCGSSPHMLLPQFRDAMVRLAKLKYPLHSPVQAMIQMFTECLANFQGGQSASAFSFLDSSTLSMLGAVRPALNIVYEGYFGGAKFRSNAAAAAAKRRPSAATSGSSGRRASLNASSLSHNSSSIGLGEGLTQNQSAAAAQELKRSAMAQTEAQAALVQFLSDFEVVPGLVAKSTAFSAFREVSRASDVPAEIRSKIGCPEDEDTCGARFFTYAHFAVAVTIVAQRCFADQGASALVRLLEWMDSSKGRIVFSASFPGYVPPGGANSLKLMPEKIPEECLDAIPQTLRRKSLVASGRRASTEVLAAVAASASTGSMQRSSSSSSLAKATVPVVGLPDWARRAAQQTFGHYAALGNPLNRTTMTSLKFNRFLRDCGLLSSEAQGAVTFGFTPDGRRASTVPSSPATPTALSFKQQGGVSNLAVAELGSASKGTAGVNRSSSRGSLQRHSISGTPTLTAFGRGSPTASEPSSRRQSLSLSVSEAKAGGHLRGLPLKVFMVPPLTQVEADLVYVQVSGSGKKPAQTRLMSVEGFVRALADVAKRCMPPECVSGSQAVEDFCQRVLVPLNEILLSSRSEEISSAFEMMEKPEISKLLAGCKAGMQKIFQMYTAEVALRRPHWNSESMSRFATDFNLLSDVSHLPLQRIFQDLSHHESCTTAGGVEGELSLDGLSIAFVMIAQKTFSGQAFATPEERILIFLQRLNAVASQPSIAPRFGLTTEALLALPKEARESTRKSLLGSTVTSSEKRVEEVSWSDLVGLSGVTF